MRQYIDKDKAMEEITKLSAYLDSLHEQRLIEKILSIIDTLEVKEVDYDKEITEYLKNFENANIGHRLSLRRCAKHFFELGMAVGNKAQKGE